MIFDYLNLAVSSLLKKKMRSWLTLLGIFIGVVAVVSLMGLGEGLKTAITEQFGFLGTDILSVTASGGLGPPGTGVLNPLTDREIAAIKKVPGVEGAAGRIMEPGKLGFNRKVGFGYAASMPDGEERKVMEHLMNMEAQKGRLLEDGDSGLVFLGASFYDENNGFGKPITAGSKIRLNDKEFEVIGIMEKKGNLQLDMIVFMNEDDLRDLTGRQGDDYDVIAVTFNENADVNRIQASIEKELRKIRNVKEGEEDFAVQTPASILENVNSVLLGIQIFVYIIAGISILVGGIGIMNTMYTAVMERTKEIGIMKSIGAKNSAIFSIFFVESGLLGMTGGLIGMIVGVLAATSLAFIGKLALGSELIAAHFPYWLILGSLLGSFILGSFFGTLPALQASKMSPVDALRFSK